MVVQGLRLNRVHCKTESRLQLIFEHNFLISRENGTVRSSGALMEYVQDLIDRSIWKTYHFYLKNNRSHDRKCLAATRIIVVI